MKYLMLTCIPKKQKNKIRQFHQRERGTAGRLVYRGANRRRVRRRSQPRGDLATRIYII